MKKLPKGFIVKGTTCGLYTHRRLDVGLIYSKKKCASYSVFTKNIVAASPVIVSKRNIKNNINAILVNSGCANACTGIQGLKNADDSIKYLSKKINTNKSNIFVASTGIIGRQLDIKKIKKGIDALTKDLSKNTKQDITDFSKSIMTTDTFNKVVSCEFVLGGKNVRIIGFAKGSGMIHPDMATMLTFFLTDVNISSLLLKKAFNEVVSDSFNCLTVDGDTSTNDSAFILSSALAENKLIKTQDKSYKLFYKNLKDTALSLTEMMARDGEGATKLVRIIAKGLKNKTLLKRVAHTIGTSPLVKTACFGNDPNWGRIIAAAGRSGINFDPGKVSIKINKCLVVKNGEEFIKNKKKVASCMKGKEVNIEIDFGMGQEEVTVYTCDLSYDYIKINADYHT